MRISFKVCSIVISEVCKEAKKWTGEAESILMMMLEKVVVRAWCVVDYLPRHDQVVVVVWPGLA